MMPKSSADPLAFSDTFKLAHKGSTISCYMAPVIHYQFLQQGSGQSRISNSETISALPTL